MNSHLVRVTDGEVRLLQMVRDITEFEKIEIKKAEGTKGLVVFKTRHEKAIINY